MVKFFCLVYVYGLKCWILYIKLCEYVKGYYGYDLVILIEEDWFIKK